MATHTTPIKGIIINGPGTEDYGRATSIFSLPTDTTLRWTIVDPETRRFFSIRPYGHPTPEGEKPTVVIGKLLLSGPPNENNGYYRPIIIHARNVDGKSFYLVGRYRYKDDRFGEVLIYEEEAFFDQPMIDHLGITRPQERIWQSGDIPILSEVVQAPGRL